MGKPGALSVQIAALEGRACLRLQAWTPEIERGVASVATTAVRVLSIAPGDWLIQSRGRSGAELQRVVASYLPGDSYALLDVSDSYACFEVQAPAARELLSKGCGLDLHPQSFPPGQTARTRFAGIHVVIVCLEDPSYFELMVARSYGHYLRAWLADAAIEFQSA